MLTHRSELEQVGVHRDVVEDLDAVRHDPRDEEQPPLLKWQERETFTFPRAAYLSTTTNSLMESQWHPILYSRVDKEDAAAEMLNSGLIFPFSVSQYDVACKAHGPRI